MPERGDCSPSRIPPIKLADQACRAPAVPRLVTADRRIRWASRRVTAPARGGTTGARRALSSRWSRTLCYAVAGSQWANTDLSSSFVPDGAALDGGHTSALFAHLDAQHATAAWQREFGRALQTWAQYTPLNFRLVGDDGSPQGTTGSAQGDPRFGDVRLSARTADVLGFAWFPSTTTRGGDVTVSTKYQFGIGSIYDLYSLLLHESGHALGLAHVDDPAAIMSTSATQVWTGLGADDIAGAQALYGPRLDDAFDAPARNDSIASATRLAPDTSGLIAVTADLTSLADVDHYGVVVPAGSDGTVTVSIDARALSLMAPAVARVRRVRQPRRVRQRRRRLRHRRHRQPRRPSGGAAVRDRRRRSERRRLLDGRLPVGREVRHGRFSGPVANSCTDP